MSQERVLGSPCSSPLVLSNRVPPPPPLPVAAPFTLIPSRERPQVRGRGGEGRDTLGPPGQQSQA